jgi:hypothetical protein
MDAFHQDQQPTHQGEQMIRHQQMMTNQNRY